MSKQILAAIAALVTLGLYGPPAAAGDADYWLYRYRVPERYAYGSHPSYDDRWGYGYVQRGYYPYYNSNYWVSRKDVRYRYRYDYALPPYYQAWGFNRKDYQHREFHRQQEGWNWPWHW